MTMSVSGVSAASAWQVQQGGIASAGGNQAAPAQAAQATAQQQIAAASAAMATGSTFSIMA